METRLDHRVTAVSDWSRSNTFHRDVCGAEIVEQEPGPFPSRFGEQQVNVHGPGVDAGDLVARLAVRPGNSDPCPLEFSSYR